MRRVKTAFFDRKIISLLVAGLLVLVCMRVYGPRETLDSKFFYDGEVAERVLYGVPLVERQRYFVCELLDLVYIGVYSSLLFLSFGKFSMSLRARSFWALAPGVVDLAETVLILWALRGFVPVETLSWFGFVTALKWLLAGVSIFSLSLHTWRARVPQSGEIL
jgi:hypothetical protein